MKWNFEWKMRWDLSSESISKSVNRARLGDMTFKFERRIDQWYLNILQKIAGGILIISKNWIHFLFTMKTNETFYWSVCYHIPYQSVKYISSNIDIIIHRKFHYFGDFVIFHFIFIEKKILCILWGKKLLKRG